MKELIEVINHQRHDWLNHIQVLLGYLKLEKYETCEEYIQKIVTDAARDTLVSQLGYPPLVAYLLSFNALHNTMRIEVEIPASFSLLSFEEGPRLGEFILSVVQAYQQYARYNGGKSNTLLLTLHHEEGMLRMVADFVGELDDSEIVPVLDRSKAQAEEWGGKVQLAPHMSSESVFECLFPLS